MSTLKENCNKLEREAYSQFEGCKKEKIKRLVNLLTFIVRKKDEDYKSLNSLILKVSSNSEQYDEIFVKHYKLNTLQLYFTCLISVLEEKLKDKVGKTPKKEILENFRLMKERVLEARKRKNEESEDTSSQEMLPVNEVKDEEEEENDEKEEEDEDEDEDEDAEIDSEADSFVDENKTQFDKTNETMRTTYKLYEADGLPETTNEVPRENNQTKRILKRLIEADDSFCERLFFVVNVRRKHMREYLEKIVLRDAKDCYVYENI